MDKKTEHTEEDHLEVISAFFHALVTTDKSLLEYIQKFEIYELLNKNQKELLNKIAVPITNFIDKEYK